MKSTKFTAAVLAAAMAFSAMPAAVYADWDTVNGNTVYTDKNGDNLTGFQKIDGKTYYFDKDGYMVTGWLTKNKKRYYFSSDGVMKTGWLKLKNGDKYYLDDNGVMLTGRQTISGNTYYFSSEGIMQTGWVESSSGNKYYFKSSGKMVKSCSAKIGGVSYTFDDNGKAAEKKSKTTVKKNTTPKELVMPKTGMSSSEFLSESGIANYTYDSSERTYSGQVLFDGITSSLFATFNSKDQLVVYAVYTPCTYKYFSSYVSAFKETLGYDYEYKSFSYTWSSGGYYVSLTYYYSNEKMSLMVFDGTYYD